MKSASRMASIVLGVCVVGSVIAVAQPQQDPALKGQPAQPEAQRGRGQPRGGGELASVESAMKLLNRSVRRLKGQIADPAKKEENLKLVGEVERAIVFAKSQPMPERKGGEPRGEAGRQAPRNAAVEQPEPKQGTQPGAEPQGEAKKPEADP